MKANHSRYRILKSSRSSERSFFKQETTEPAFFDSQSASTFFTAAPQAIQRKCDGCEEEQKKGDAGKDSTKPAKPAIPDSPRGMTILGKKLMDFSDQWLAQLKAALKEKAPAANYDVGKNIVFDKGEYSPEKQKGKRLLAHELAHVVRQRGPVSLQDQMGRDGDNKEPKPTNADADPISLRDVIREEDAAPSKQKEETDGRSIQDILGEKKEADSKKEPEHEPSLQDLLKNEEEEKK